MSERTEHEAAPLRPVLCDRLVVVGLGLVGGSVARALRRVSDQEHLDFSVLEAGVLLLSSLGRIEPVQQRTVVAQLERLGAELRQLQRGRPRTAASAARALRELLGRREGFSSLRANHYDLRNGLFDSVAKTGEGTSVALTVLYLMVARRAGIPASAPVRPRNMLVERP